MGATLQQEHHPIAFFNYIFSPTMINASAYDHELCTIIEYIKKWRYYLLSHKFLVLTNHATFRHLLTQSIQTPSQQKWLKHLMALIIKSSIGLVCKIQ